MKTQKISIHQATPNMKVADDIYSYNNHLIIPKNTVLTDKMITRLNFYSIDEINICIDEEIEPEIREIEELNYRDKVKSSVDFRKFQENYNSCITDIKSYLDAALNSRDNIDLNKLLKDTSSVLDTKANSIQVFDMLHCMRDYDDSTYAHSLSVALICKVMGQWLKYSDDDIQTLTLCGLLHDIGKLSIPHDIICKPDKLTISEYEIVKTHPLHGYNLLKEQRIDERIKNATLMHHERCDGKGYPLNLESTKIDDFAKILSIADVYDAMTSKRVYRGPLCPFEVIELFEKDGYQKFDPHFLLCFLEGISQTYINNTVRLSDGRVGEIVLMNPHCYARPMIHVKDDFVDLSQYPELTIEAIL